MVEASSGYPLLDAFWTMIVFFAWVVWIWLLFMVFADLFSRHDIGGWAKAGWTVFVLVIPIVGVLVYLIAESHGMEERKQASVAESQKSFDDYVRSVAASKGGGAEEISKAKELLDSGAITPTEYEQIKSKALAG